MDKPPLFRRINTTAHGARSKHAGDFRDERHAKATLAAESGRSSMHGTRRHGLDYTPLFRFLLSRVGEDWNAVHAEAVSRLDRAAPIAWLVALRAEDERAVVRTGESSYFSGLKVDDQGRLQRVDPRIGPATFAPACGCCTHTINGVRFARRFGEGGDPLAP